MNSFLITFHIITSILIILAVLLQVGRGAELGAAFGSMGQAQSSRGPQSFMAKFTAVIAFLFMLTSAMLTYQTSKNQQTSVMDQVQIEETAPIPTPATGVPTEPIEMPSPAATAKPE